ncbi:AraC family transcriptional regulator [Yinghuangia soli]|uniref:AraC family transcriptional regulator n=1 Tax=Yinghuangia soli TaxID=2908204 RepID=A0AA41U0L0_9ACTN|nr:AraC family transcriptional regulator [Yinghuangia soli]MCF2528706.1 AraC family transcriptional regulator [Yinghuangia soli]MCF2531425.1 AraC family transcriptional regulator [Yinghuangia soli]
MADPSSPPLVVPSLPWRFSTRTTDIDLASAQGAETYYPLRMGVLGRAQRFMMSIDAMQLGAVLVGDCRFDADISMDFEELRDFYHVNIPLSGHLISTNLGNEVIATPQHAVVFGPTGSVRLNHWDAGSRILCVKIGRVALEAELERLLQRPVRTPINLAPALDLSGGYGRILRDLACLLARQVAAETPLARQEIIGVPLWHNMLSHLLAAGEHDYRDELLGPGRPCRPPAVKRVVEAMHAAPETPFTAASLADLAGVSIRTLQAAFRTYVNMAPMAYLRNVRLERVHAELAASPPTRTTVTEVAHRWGFTHLGRFAAAYGRKYGVPPSETLWS